MTDVPGQLGAELVNQVLWLVPVVHGVALGEREELAALLRASVAPSV